MEQVAGYPKNLAYNLKVLNGSLIRQRILISSDKTSYTPNERCQFNFPIGRMIDNRSICLTAKCTAAVGNHFPRGGLNSLIENLQISINSRIIQSTQAYNYIWNTLADVSGYYSPEQASKRIYENFDPSVDYDNTSVDGSAVPTIVSACITTTGTDEYYFCVNNWLGWFNSSAPTINTNDLGTIQLVLTWAPNTCMWVGAASSASGSVAVGNYSISDVNLSMDTITFTNSMYQDLVKSQLDGNGLNIAYNDYLISTGNTATKSATATISHTAQFSTNSLDLVMATFRPSNFNHNLGTALLLGDATLAEVTADHRGSSLTANALLAAPLTTNNRHGGFNQSRYFQRAGGAIKTSSWYINSQPFTINSSPVQIFNSTLQALDYANLDIASGGLHIGANQPVYYNKNYFVDCLSLENLSGDNNNWVSGISANGGVLSVVYNATFSGASVESSVIPYIIARVTKVMNVKTGRNIDIME
jgi:hypothetical protein